jgi:rhodanese-related sulfurtransferase
MIMKKLNLFVLALLCVPVLLLTSCDRGDDINPENPILQPAFDVMTAYMLENELDLTNILSGPGGEVKFVAGPPAEADLDAFLNKYTILDIRSLEAYNSGHIQGAKHVAFADILKEADAASKQVLVVCFTGQTACYAVSLLRLAGHANAQSLKWGMSGWNPETAGPWNGNTGDEAKGHGNWAANNAPSNLTFDNPVIDIFSTDGGEILRQRVEAVIASGFKTAKGTDVLNNPENYFINNYFSDADYGKFGHLKEAYRIKEELMLEGNGHKGLDSGKNAKVITYCYTGQTSAVVTAWLQVLGYDAYSMTFGMNGIYHSNPAWSSNQWGVDSKPKNLPLIKN